MRVVCIYFGDELSSNQELQGVAEAFYRATPQIMLRSKQAIFLEIGKCNALYSEESFLKRTRATLHKLDLKAKIGIAHDIPSALSFAVYGTAELQSLPIDALRFYANPLGDQIEVEKNIIKTILVLKDLGVRCLRDFLSIPQAELSSRFGSLGQMCFLRVQGLHEILWKPFVLSEVVSEKCEFDQESPVDNLEPIYLRMKPMLEKLSMRLKAKGKRLKSFDVVLKQEHAMTPLECLRSFEIVLQLPQVSNKILFQITQEKIDAGIMHRPLKARITEFSILVTEDVPYSMNQKDLFNQKKEETQESFFQLVSRISTKLGEGSSFFAKPQESYLPENNWLKGSQPHQNEVKDQLPERPLRVFHYAKPVQYMGRKLLSQDFNEEVEEWSDKEVVFSEWWNSPLERVYYRVLTKTGRELWMYRTSRGDFLHGEFD